MKEHDVIIFLGEAVAGAGNSLKYPVGERHAALLFMCQEKGAPPDWSSATAKLEARGWSDVKLAKASSAKVEALDSVHPYASTSYEEAKRDGFSALIFSEPIDETL